MDNVLSYLQPVDDRAVSEIFRGLIRAAVLVSLLKSGFAQFFSAAPRMPVVAMAAAIAQPPKPPIRYRRQHHHGNAGPAREGTILLSTPFSAIRGRAAGCDC